MRCGWSLSMIGRGLSWWSVWAFYSHRRPHDSVTAIDEPDAYAWGLAERLLAALGGHKTGSGGDVGTSSRVEQFGTAVDRADVLEDPWFWPVAA